MHVEERELYADFDAESKKKLEKMNKDWLDAFKKVPRELKTDAEQELGNQEKVVVDRSRQSGRNLLAWAKNERNKRKRARKAAKKARKRQR